MTVHSVSRLPVHQGVAAWDAILPPCSEGQSLLGDRTADFVIIGAGFAGLSAALRLTQLMPNASIVILEAGYIAEGATGRNSGFMIDLPHDLQSEDYAGTDSDSEIIKLNRQAIAFGREAVEAYHIDPNYFDAAGKINGAASAVAHRNNVSYAGHLENMSEPSEMLDQKQMQDVTGSTHYRSGLYTAGTVMLQPAGYVRGLADGLSRQGVSVFENSPVIQFSREGGGWSVKTTNGSVSTQRVILTVNGHLESFGFERGRLMQVFLYASMTKDLSREALSLLGGQPRWGVTPADPMGTTMRRIDTGQGGNRIITRTCATLAPDMLVSDKDVARAARVHQTKFDQRFPKLAGTKMEHQWAGHLCLSQNGSAVVREIDEGVFSGCVQNGLGTTRGTLTGIAAAELAYGHSSKITEFFKLEKRPPKLLPKPLLKTGGNAIVRYKEWRAANE